MTPFYHVCVTRKSSPYDVYKLDMSEDYVKQRIVGPYDSGASIVVSGTIVASDDIERIVITETRDDSSRILPVVKQERARSGVISMIPLESDVVAKGKDMTDQFILGPPGNKKKPAPATGTKPGNRVFVVHGHDEVLKNELELFLVEIGLEPIVLHKKPDEGDTIIEKIEKYSDVSYAFVILTPDDIGYSKPEETKPDDECKKEPRARQNVIFELGYFVGKLGRNKVTCLYKAPLTLPTDYSGVLYKEIPGKITALGYEIMKELKAAGLDLKG